MLDRSRSLLSSGGLLSSWGGFSHQSGVKQLSGGGRRSRIFEMPELCLVKTGKHPSSWLG